MTKYGIGQPVTRFEDPRLLRGQGRFIRRREPAGPGLCGDSALAACACPDRAIDTAAALAAPGVLAVFTEADLAADGLGTMRVSLQRKRPDGSPLFVRPHPGLARGRVRYVGDPVAMIVAETFAQASDAAELIDVDYEPLPSVTDTARRRSPARRRSGTNARTTSRTVRGSATRAATDAAFAGAAHVVRRRYVISPRLRAVHGAARRDRRLRSGRGTLHALRRCASIRIACATRSAHNIFKVPESKVRVVAGDVGGGFGTKGWQYVEHRLVLWAARKLRRPVKWTCERSEAIQADEHARDNVTEAELALDAEGRFIGLRVRTDRNVRRLSLVRTQSAADLRQCAHAGRRLCDPGGLCRMSPVAFVEQQPDRALSRRRPARGDLCHRAADRRRGARTGHRSGRAAAQEPDPGERDAVQERRSASITIAASSRGHGHGAGSWPTYDGFAAPRAKRRQSAANCAASARQRDRARRLARPRIRRDPLQSRRHGHVADGHQEPGPGPRDDVQADPARAARPRARARSSTSTAIPTASPSASAPWARARP